MKIGPIGVGIMGHGVRLDLLKARHDLMVIAHRTGRRSTACLARSEQAGSTLELTRASDAVVLWVTDSPTSHSVIETLLGALRADALVIDLTTNHPDAPVKPSGTAAVQLRYGCGTVAARMRHGLAR